MKPWSRKGRAMALDVAFQMDPIENVDIDADSTFRLAEAAAARGHNLFVYTPDRLAYEAGRITARARPVEVRRVRGDHVSLGEERLLDLDRAGPGGDAPGF